MAMATPMSTTTTLDADEQGEHMDQKEFRTREGGVNGSRQKFFSKKMRTPTRRTWLPNHISDSTTQVG
jgi:hypothetical protein